jgi:hypothetical protein
LQTNQKEISNDSEKNNNEFAKALMRMKGHCHGPKSSPCPNLEKMSHRQHGNWGQKP